MESPALTSPAEATVLEGSFWEFALIFVLALVVFGPERLPGLARRVGLWVGRARAVLSNLSQQIERELEAEEMRAAASKVKRDLGAGVTGSAPVSPTSETHDGTQR